jgi:hypothetical protein
MKIFYFNENSNHKSLIVMRAKATVLSTFESHQLSIVVHAKHGMVG